MDSLLFNFPTVVAQSICLAYNGFNPPALKIDVEPVGIGIPLTDGTIWHKEHNVKVESVRFEDAVLFARHMMDTGKWPKDPKFYPEQTLAQRMGLE